MKHEIQVHFSNCGQVQWHEEIDDVGQWLEEVMNEAKIVAHDEETNRFFGLDMSTVTAIIVSEEKEQVDIWSRTYASVQGKVEENSHQKHPRDDGNRISAETGGRCCP